MLLDSTFSVLCIFCFDVVLCLSFRTFLFGDVSVEVGGLIGDLLSFDLVLEGDFSVAHSTGRVVVVISILFS